MTLGSEQPEFYTLDDLAAILKLSRSTVYRRRKQDNWPHLQIGAELRFTPEDFEAIQRLYRQPEVTPKIHRSRPNVGTKADRARAKAQSAKSPQQVRKGAISGRNSQPQEPLEINDPNNP